MRVEAFIEPIQDSWRKVAEIMDSQNGEGKYQAIFKDITKKQLALTDVGDVLHPYSVIIYNKTSFPFITSDNPVVRRQINIVDALKIIPKKYLVEIEDESIEFACFFLPLSPSVAYISCELIKSCENLTYSYDELENVFYLNYCSIINSNEEVYSSVLDPMKSEDELSKHLSSRGGTTVKIFTQSKRIVCKGVIESSTKSTVSLKLHDLEKIKLLKNKEQVKLMEVTRDGVSIRGMRNCKIVSINYDNGVVAFEPTIQLGM